uniref:ly6/PLAUR domain-containing protein 1 isoform X2 n=1 Tax=Jaculus jaculus TaxID=51337 RepID=UPI001E1B4C84|nr:ly6/PLAUR domain-containing protein 1 isoform X2 [Jaculus jaculus]XP_045007311.1 ly6/PLAUR domain-containing protein 1 isoform X2 [Jaculus jaculus]
MWVLGIAATFCGLFLLPGFALQIQCYQCEEFQLNNDCSSPEFIVNCTVNVQDMCQKEVMEQSAGSFGPGNAGGSSKRCCENNNESQPSPASTETFHKELLHASKMPSQVLIDSTCPVPAHS